MRLVVEVELSGRQIKTVCQNALQRIFDLGIKVAEVSPDPDAGTFIEDAEEVGQIAASIWDAARDAFLKGGAK